MAIAAQIDEGKITFAHALRYLGLLTFFVLLIENIVGMQKFFLIDIPIIDELLYFLTEFLVIVLVATLLFLAIRIVGGKGSFRKTLITWIIILVALIPLVTIVDAVVFAISQEVYSKMLLLGSRIQNMFSLFLTCPMLSVVHKVSPLRIFGALFIFSTFIVAVLVFFF